ncbi:bacteriocin biosynthesis cyclodehydratase domain-containing protein [Clavibacter sp. B3I6]|nr:bacteriocin biosynthesis cyclodehydratase domain-containing protein [Clavibacter sp. B3I6]
MAIRLDPRLPLVWRTPDSLQLGVDRPPVVLTAVSRLDERLLDALRHGISRGGLDMIAATEGATPAQVTQLLDLVRPALLPPREPVASVTPATEQPPQDERAPLPRSPRRGPVAVLGGGPTAERIADALARAGHDVRMRRLADDADPHAALAVLVAHFAIAPAVYGRWAREDVPHLPVVIGDRHAAVGPLVEPGRTACCYCLDLHRVDADPAWPAIATQLLGRDSGSEAGLAPAELAGLAARPAHVLVSTGGNALASHQAVLDVRTGRVTRRASRPHPRCGCRALPGTATAPADPTAAVRSGSRRAAARIGRA